jgi:aerobic carbon-monoxide dehydrogenase medium subunit
MHDFDFLEPSSVAEASRMAADLGEGVRFIAGGTALMLALRQRMLAPTHLLSLAGLEALRGISFSPVHGLRIGALSLHAEVAESALVQQAAPMLAAMAARVANPQVRNQGTLGGNLCYADPATDPPTCLLALDARVLLASHRGLRELPLSEFLVDYYSTALQADELVQAIVVPPLPTGAQGHYLRHLRTAAEHRPMASVAALVQHSGGVCAAARLVVGAATAVPRRLQRAEGHLVGQAITPTRVAEAAAMAAQDIEAIDDLRGSAAYRREVVRVQTERCLSQLLGLTGH